MCWVYFLVRQCETLPDIAHGHKFHIEGAITDERPDTGQSCDNSPGDSCHYRCSLGYRLTGHPGLLCQDNGSWAGHIPECNSKYILSFVYWPYVSRIGHIPECNCCRQPDFTNQAIQSFTELQ